MRGNSSEIRRRYLFVSAPFGGIEVMMSNLQRLVAERPDIDASWLFLRPGDNEWYTHMPIIRRNWTLKLGLLVRSRVQKLLDGGTTFDAIICNSLSVLTFMHGICRRIPTILWVDCTPEMLNGSGRWYREPSASRRTARRKMWDALHTDRIYADAALIVALSDTAKKSLVEQYGVDVRKVLHIPSGILVSDWLDGYRPPAGGKFKGEKPRVLFVGGDFVRKGGEILLNVAMRPEFRDTEFHLVTRADLKNLPGNVILHQGILPNSPELHSLYRSADVFALPTFADFSPTNAICEAMASGIPVITCRVGGLEEVVRENENGYVIEPGKSDALAAAILRLLNSQDRARMGAAGQRIATQDFDLRRNFQKVLNAVENIIAQNQTKVANVIA